MPKLVSEKMGLKAGMRAFFHNPPGSALEAIGLPRVEATEKLDGEYDYIHLFSTHQSDLNAIFERLRAHLKPTGMLWVSWPKGKRLESDLTLPEVIRIGYRHGLVETPALSVDAVWSGLKFTHPKPGKTYHNSYGKLPEAGE